MNIKDVEKATGISKQNIRFYEKSGLLHPRRNEENGYREYTDEEIRTLKLVKMLRMLDMPIEQIKLVLVCPQQMPHLLAQQTRLLEEKLESTKYAITLCENLRKADCTPEALDVDSYLEQMEQHPGSFFAGWVSDYKSVKQYQHEKPLPLRRTMPLPIATALQTPCMTTPRKTARKSPSPKKGCIRSL